MNEFVFKCPDYANPEKTVQDHLFCSYKRLNFTFIMIAQNKSKFKCIMKNSYSNFGHFGGIQIVLFILLFSCTASQKTVHIPINYKDPVCGMSLQDNDDPYNWKYKGSTFTFCSYNCKKTFMMNPEKFTMEKKCEEW